MTPDFAVPLALYALISSGSPGPNNVMLLASAANFGLRRTLPHLAGVSGGIVVMFCAIGLGLERAFTAWPALRMVLTAAGVLYLLWLAWRIATAAAPAPDDGAGGAGQPLTFLQAALFQWVNPKIWVMGVTVMTVYAPGQSPPAILAAVAVFAAVNLPCIVAWAALGRPAARFLADRRRLRVFNWTMAGLLVLSLYPALF